MALYRQRTARSPEVIYYAHRREVIRRGMAWCRFFEPCYSRKTAKRRKFFPCAFRTVGDMTCTCPVDSTAATVDAIVAETAVTRITERGATRMDDQTSEASMELRKKEGYF